MTRAYRVEVTATSEADIADIADIWGFIAQDEPNAATAFAGSHAPAWEQVATLWRRVVIRCGGETKTAFPREAWKRDNWL